MKTYALSAMHRPGPDCWCLPTVIQRPDHCDVHHNDGIGFYLLSIDLTMLPLSIAGWQAEREPA